jgi:hypothetical protein
VENEDMKIITNHKPHPILYWDQLSPKEKKEFTFSNKEESEYFRYRGNIYTLGDFMRCTGPFEGKNYDGYLSDSFFSGILIKYTETNSGQAVICATYIG